MKLKKLFSAKKYLAAGLLALSLSAFSFFSCESTELSVPVPGQGAVKTRNIYAEYYILGDSYYKLEDYKKASEYYELAMKKKEQYWAAYYKLAKCYIFISDWDNALPMYKKILERDPENASLKASLAYIYSMQGDFKRSITIYEELLEAQPVNQEYLENYLAVLAADTKKFEKKHAVKFTSTYETLKTEYPENKNLKTFEDKYKELMNIVDEEEEGEETEEGQEEEESDNSTVIE
ncbi:tetratricopeptide repeat protein [Treponema bryantii]|uniref:tetratricopeptide repeat protein n=1 Tax=Treponema bryantii TaxID=163 RepID=UPI0003B37139|nr:tetratricopeptide repeat protein [Treponema bryantii]